MRDVNLGWLYRAVHANGARFFFICLYAHVARGLYYGSFILNHVWIVGCSILLASIATAFFGYVLPWGQISFWGTAVITNLFSVLPYIGKRVVTWLWGGFAVDNPTLTRFFIFHFILPFIILALSGIHLFFLHLIGSRNPLGLSFNIEKIKFHPYFSWKDILGGGLFIQLLIFIRFFWPWTLGDPENFIPANPLITPIHIQPEWYFLFAYSILRRIPNKLGGVMALLFSVLIYYFIPLIKATYFKGNQFNPLNKVIFWIFVGVLILLTWIGARPVESPYFFTGQILVVLYFIWFIFSYFNIKIWSKIF